VSLYSLDKNLPLFERANSESWSSFFLVLGESGSKADGMLEGYQRGYQKMLIIFKHA
jgi:hypothetical protein